MAGADQAVAAAGTEIGPCFTINRCWWRRRSASVRDAVLIGAVLAVVVLFVVSW